jgi:hypothetical protein
VEKFVLKENGVGEGLLTSAMFADLPALKELNLSGNNGILSLPKNLIQGLHSLKTINLAGNQIRALEGGIFAGIGSLNSLNLSYNNISVVDAQVFAPENFPRSAMIYLQANDLPQGAGERIISQHGDKIELGREYVPQNADFGKMDGDGYLRKPDGSLALMNFYYARKACPAGFRLPTFRELAEESVAYGAKIEEIDHTKPKDGPYCDGSYYVSVKMPDGKVDDFCFEYETGYSRPDGVFGRHWFWSSSIAPGNSDNQPRMAYGFGGGGRGGSIATMHETNPMWTESVRCTIQR